MVASLLGKEMVNRNVHFYFRIVVPVLKILLILTFNIANKIVDKFRFRFAFAYTCLYTDNVAKTI